jgi:hypothetical protein
VDSVQEACYDYCSYFMYTFASNGTDPQAIPGESDVNLSPSWSNDGRQVAYAAETYYGTELWATNIDGSNNRRLAAPYYGVQDTAWSPDGTAIAYTSGGYLRCHGFDSVRPCAFVNTPALGPLSWSPDGTKLAFMRETPQPRDSRRDIFVLDRASGAVQQLTSDPADDAYPTWAPDGTKIAFASTRDDAGTTFCVEPFYRQCQSAIYTMDVDGSDQTRASRVFDRRVGGLDWQPLPVNTPSSHPRPRSANQVHVSLVPTFVECTAPDRQHGPPLVAGSCSNPSTPSIRVVVSPYNSVPAPTKSAGHVRLATIAGAPGAPDDSDVRFDFRLRNVMYGSYLTDYTGDVLVVAPLRITDREGAVSSTVQDYPLRFKVRCTATPEETVGAICEQITTADAVMPGLVPEGGRSVWDVGRIQVFDGGADFDVDTGPNDPFVTQGVFVP